MKKIQIILTFVLFSIGFGNYAQTELDQYGNDPLFIPLFNHMKNKQYDSAMVFLDGIILDKYPLHYYKTALMFKIDIKLDNYQWDMSLVNDMGEMLKYWEADSSNFLNMYGVVLRRNGLNEKAREIFELGYSKYGDQIYLNNILSLNNIEEKPERNLKYEDAIIKDSIISGYFILGESYRQLKELNKAIYYFKLYESTTRGAEINPRVYIEIIKIINETKVDEDVCFYKNLFVSYIENLSEYEKQRVISEIEKVNKEMNDLKLKCK